MSTQMGDFLLKLSQDPFLTEKFKDDPSSVMADFDLTPAEAELVLKRDIRAMHESFRVLALCSGNIKPIAPKPGPKPGPGPKPKKKASKKK